MIAKQIDMLAYMNKIAVEIIKIDEIENISNILQIKNKNKYKKNDDRIAATIEYAAKCGLRMIDLDIENGGAVLVETIFDKENFEEFLNKMRLLFAEIDLNIIVKADVQGTAEAVKASLEKIDVDGVRVNVIRSTVGAISESDVILASASQAIIYGFNVRPDAKVRNKAEEENVEIRLHNVIYKMVEEIETAMKGMLAPEYHEVITGQAEIRQVIKASKIGNIAGCYVTDGSIKRNCGIRLIRDGIVVYEGKLASLRRFKDDVKEVNAGFECGLNIENYNDIKEGDIIEGYVMEEVEKK